MGYKKTDPSCYVVLWADERIIKAGYSHCQRWRKFAKRGAEVVRVSPFARTRDAFALESQIDAYLRSIGVPAFNSRHQAVPWLGSDGGGWAECFIVPNPADAVKQCDRIANAFTARTAIADATDGQYVTHVQTQTCSPIEDSSPNASRAGGQPNFSSRIGFASLAQTRRTA